MAYGSNQSAGRLQRYLDRSPSPAPPVRSLAVSLPHRLFFAHESRVWTGGTAFVDPVRGPHRTPCRAWLLRRDQFDSLVAQENHLPSVDLPPALDLAAGETRVVADRRYGLLLGCDPIEGHPALTFTTPEQPLPPATRPAPAYVATIVEGLVDGHGLSEAAARALLDVGDPGSSDR